MLPDIVLFEGRDRTSTVSLWETDGTQSGTFVLTNVASPPPLITGEPNYGFVPLTSVSLDLTVFNGQVLFAGRYNPLSVPRYTGPLYDMDDRRHSERHRSADHRRGEFKGTLF